MKRPIVLVLGRYYLPGHKGGGQLRTIANMIEQLGDVIDFRLITSDRDMGNEHPYDTVPIDQWLEIGGTPIWYASREQQGIFRLARLIRETPHDVLYLNSYFDPGFTIGPLAARRLGMLDKRPVVLAPRGEFSAGALGDRGSKRAKKVAYHRLATTLGLLSEVVWQASSEHEAADIRRVVGPSTSRIVIAPDLSPPAKPATMVHRRVREPGEPLRACFISRISPKKNLDFALRALRDVRAPVVFDIYGPREDPAYWAYCEEEIRKLPAHVTATYRGDLRHEEVPTTFGQYDLFLFPTRGENFGHVIMESLRAGTPVLIPDTTPWRDLEAEGAGWVVPLERAAFTARIEEAAGWTGEEQTRRRERTREFGERRAADPSVAEANRRLFLDLVAR